MSHNGAMTITEFLEARITEDEAAAERGGYHNGGGAFSNDNYGCLLVQPARVLAECAAKRALITLFRSGVKFEVSAGEVTGWVSPLIIMAIPYKDHPDYQQEWAA